MTYYPTNRSFAYKEASVNTATPEKLVVMLYEGAIRFLRQSVEDIKAKDIVAKGRSTDRAVAILQHLQSTLDMDNGGLIAAELDRLYTYVLSRVLEGSGRLDVGAIEEAIKLLTVLLSGWEEVVRKERVPLVSSTLLSQQHVANGRIQLHA